MELSEVDLTNPDLFRAGKHHDMFAVLRRDDPVHWQEEATGAGFWAVTRHADVVKANRDAATFISGEGFTLLDIGDDAEAGSGMRQMLPGMDAPLHTRHRRIVNRGFTPRVLGLLEAHLRAKAVAIVDNVVARGECDFVVDVASELPLQAIAELMGVPQEDRSKLFDWSNRLIGIDDPEYQGDREGGMVAATEMFIYSDGLRELRTADPHDDIVTKLVNAEIEGDRLTDDEFSMFFMLLTVAGNETTRNATTHGMRALIDHPDQYARLSADPSKERVEQAVEEVLRWASPVLYFRRTAAVDTELGGKAIKAGDKVALWYISANRDDDAFPDPFTFDIERTGNDHVAFGGGGPHFCLGANLARMELRLIFTEIVTRIPDMRLQGEPEMLRSNFIGGIKHMPVTFTPSDALVAV